MRLFHFFLVLLFVAMVYGDGNDDDYDDVTEDSAVEQMAVDVGSYDGESSGNVTDYEYPDDARYLPVLSRRARCTGEFHYGKNKTKIKYLTRNAREDGNPVIHPMGFKQVKNGKSRQGVKLIDTCCVKIFARKRYQGRSQKLEIGHDGPINFKFRSMKFGVCSWL